MEAGTPYFSAREDSDFMSRLGSFTQSYSRASVLFMAENIPSSSHHHHDEYTTSMMERSSTLLSLDEEQQQQQQPLDRYMMQKDKEKIKSLFSIVTNTIH